MLIRFTPNRESQQSFAATTRSRDSLLLRKGSMTTPHSEGHRRERYINE
jgi:hypothetical protein